MATLVKLVQERIPERFRLDPIRDVQVLCPMNRGSLGVRELNTALQKVLNPTRSARRGAVRTADRLATVALERLAGWPSLRYRKDKRTALREDPGVKTIALAKRVRCGVY